MNKHWTNDPDLVENYVLGAIGQDERKDLEAHLSTCSSCRETVERERLLEEGVRSYGRGLLKERLKRMVNQREQRVVPWPQVVSIAAALLIIVGLSITYRWWGGEELIVHEEDVAAEIPSPEHKETLKEPGEGGAEKPAEESKRAAGTRARGETTEIAVSPSAIPPEKDVPEDRLDDSRWIYGVIVGIPLRHREGTDAALMEQRGEAGEAAKQNFRKGEKVGMMDEQEVRILQRPERELPPDQRFQLNRAMIPTMFRQRGDRVELTLFSDTLGLERQAVRVRRISPDSLLVIIDGSAVAYKIPVAQRTYR